ncbi:MAG: TetR/AcrR family transcriptional regulator [Spirochaetales bacterium]|nr:TetR/AcrR family transcriptional regulator [Spirochaetales bacterium]
MKDENSPPSPEEAIMQATIACIEEYGLTGTTNRRIAAKAKVNSAAVNYYFRSKQVLIDKVMDSTLHNAFDWEDLRKLPGDTAARWCTEVFIDLSLGAKTYPGLTRAHFHDLVIRGDYTTKGARRMQQFLQELTAELQNRGCALPRKQLEKAVAQIGSMFITIAMIPLFYREPFGIDLTREEDLKSFFGSAIERLLAP